MGIEKEIRYKINDEIAFKIRKISKVLVPKTKQIDLTLGYKGFESLEKFGYVCRVRKTQNKIWMEIKNRRDEKSFIETEVELKNFKDGVDFFEALGMKPYLYMNRTREILEYKGLKIFIDDIELLGKFVEIEYQDLENYSEILKEFIDIVEIKTNEQPLYGDIFKKEIENNVNFRKKFEETLNNHIKN